MKLSVKEMMILALLGPILFVLGDLAFEVLPNIHLVGVLLVVFTAVYRRKALFPLFGYVFLSGLYGGFSLWWIPYLYVWFILWGAVMAVPRTLSPRVYTAVLVGICALHGYLYGVLYAPAQALMFGLNLQGTLAWIVAGLPFDAVHGTANLVLGVVLITPLTRLLTRLNTLANL